MSEATERAAVVAEALTWLGTPYHHQARVKGGGVDCGQILLAVFENAGIIPHTETEDYPHDWHLHREGERYLGWVEQFAKKSMGVKLPQPGDLVLYQWGRCIAHGAIVIEWPTILHSYVGLGVILDDAVGNQNLAKRQAGVWSCWPEGGE